jgi:hypothetical protein
MGKHNIACRWVWWTGRMIIGLGILHGVVIAGQIRDVNKSRLIKTIPEFPVTAIAGDCLLYSAGIGLVLIGAGLLVCYSHAGLRRKERWSWVVTCGVGVFLGSAGILLLLIHGWFQLIMAVHLLLALSLFVPLIMMKSEFFLREMELK